MKQELLALMQAVGQCMVDGSPSDKEYLRYRMERVMEALED